jgi:hypothetical protein
MAKYRKKPVIIEAVQLRWDTWHDICEFVGVGKLEDNKPTGCFIGEDGQPLPEGKGSDEMGLLIPTLEGLMIARQNDYIIKGVQGEFYPCKKHIFLETYEAVGE